MLKIGMMTENISKFKDMKECLKTIKDIGFECADITLLTASNHPKLNKYFDGSNYINKAIELKEYADSINLELVQAHAPFPVYKENDNYYNKKMFLKLVKSIKICGALKIKNLVIHPFNDFNDLQNIEFYKKLLPYAIEENVVICCENMWRWDDKLNRARPCACSLNDSFLNVIQGVNSDNLKACVDIGHAAMFSYLGLSPRIMIEALDKYVYCLHIHDNDGIHDNHYIPFRGVIDFNDVVTALKNINYKYDLITETLLPNSIKTFDDALIFWTLQFESIKKIREMLLK